MKIVVLKFGGTSVGTIERIKKVSEIVKNYVKKKVHYKTITYKECFQSFLGFDPFTATLADLKSCALENNLPDLQYTHKDDWLNFLLGSLIEPQLGAQTPTFLTEYPSSQAALAQTQTDTWGNTIALRFELYYQGVELCNGFRELSDPKEQRKRFLLDQKTTSLP